MCKNTASKSMIHYHKSFNNISVLNLSSCSCFFVRFLVCAAFVLFCLHRSVYYDVYNCQTITWSVVKCNCFSARTRFLLILQFIPHNYQLPVYTRTQHTQCLSQPNQSSHIFVLKIWLGERAHSVWLKYRLHTIINRFPEHCTEPQTDTFISYCQWFLNGIVNLSISFPASTVNSSFKGFTHLAMNLCTLYVQRLSTKRVFKLL